MKSQAVQLPIRFFIQTTALFLLVAGLLLAGLQPVQAQGYDNIEPPQNTSTPEKVEVIEFFWLGCPHCYAFEPTISKWEKERPAYVEFVREAPPLNPSWETHSRSFYAAQLMGIEHEFVEAMFEQIHEKRKNMRKPKDVATLAESLGVDRKKFLSTMKSFAVETKMRRAMQLAKGAGLTGVPSVTINGKYRTTASKAGGYPAIIDVINERSEFERTEMGLSAE